MNNAKEFRRDLKESAPAFLTDRRASPSPFITDSAQSALPYIHTEGSISMRAPPYILHTEQMIAEETNNIIETHYGLYRGDNAKIYVDGGRRGKNEKIEDLCFKLDLQSMNSAKQSPRIKIGAKGNYHIPLRRTQSIAETNLKVSPR